MERKIETCSLNSPRLVWLCLLSGLFLIIVGGCQKDKIQGEIPVVETSAISSLDINSAACGGEISSDGGTQVTERGVCWGTELNPEIGDATRTTDGSDVGEFSSIITNLSANTTYHVRAYATNSAGTAYGEDISFNTLPGLTTSEVTDITADSVICGGNVNHGGTVLILERGVCWGNDHNPTISSYKRKKADSTGTGEFICKIKNLSPIKTYYLRAYATNPAGTSYGNEVSFTTKAEVPSVYTKHVTNITATDASSGGSCSTNSKAPIIVQGVCWDTEPNPTTDLPTKSVDGNTPSSYTSSILGLTPETKYYVRAYAVNSGGTGYGQEVWFTTPSLPPTLTTTPISAITATTASSGGNITNQGGSEVTSRGVCWSTSPNPTTSLYSKTNDGTGTGIYTSSITGLSPGTTYYLRAYASNEGGTAYGNEINFTTNVVVPTITTSELTSTTTNSSVTGGTITNNGGAAITSKGVCWDISPNPTIDLPTKTTFGTGEDAFLSRIDALTANTLYYVRAYATNSAGTAYGEELLLKTYTGTVSDIDGNIYNTVTIGTQVWMVNNLKVTKFNDGTAIPNVTDNSAWTASISPAYCWYNNSSSNKGTYGALYNWYTIDQASNGGKNICPIGWHLPSNTEYTTLADYLGGYSIAGGKLKEYGFDHWNSPNTGANNMSGFKAVSGGRRSSAGTFAYMGSTSYFWTDFTETRYRGLSSTHSYFSTFVLSDIYKASGYSIRCIKD